MPCPIRSARGDMEESACWIVTAPKMDALWLARSGGCIVDRERISHMEHESGRTAGITHRQNG